MRRAQRYGQPIGIVFPGVRYEEALYICSFVKDRVPGDVDRSMTLPFYPSGWDGGRRDLASVNNQHIFLPMFSKRSVQVKSKCLIVENFDACLKLAICRIWSDGKREDDDCNKYATTTVSIAARFCIFYLHILPSENF